MFLKRILGWLTMATTAGFVVAAPAGATGSIAATDASPAARQVGHAFASCTAGFGTTTELQKDIYLPLPGVGAIVGQALYPGNKAPQMRARLAVGMPPAQIIDEHRRVNGLAPYTSADVDTGNDLHDDLVQMRQYEIASLTATGAVFSGESRASTAVMHAWSEAASGVAGTDRFVGAAAGNTLTSVDFASVMAGELQAPRDVVGVLAELGVTVAPADVVSMRKGDLAERLFVSLAAGFARPGQGDTRCVNPTGVGGTSRSSSMSWLRVDNPDGTVAMNLRYRSLHNEDAVRELARMYYDCRMGRLSCTADVEDLSPRPTQQHLRFAFQSEPGNPVGRGESRVYSGSDSTASTSYDGRNLQLFVQQRGEAWTIEMTPPREQRFTSGSAYAIEGGARNNVGALKLTRNGAKCSRPTGHLTIDDVAFNGSALARLDAHFDDVKCDGEPGLVDGQIEYVR